jgi:hypothetical protein
MATTPGGACPGQPSLQVLGPTVGPLPPSSDYSVPLQAPGPPGAPGPAPATPPPGLQWPETGPAFLSHQAVSFPLAAPGTRQSMMEHALTRQRSWGAATARPPGPSCTPRNATPSPAPSASPLWPGGRSRSRSPRASMSLEGDTIVRGRGQWLYSWAQYLE